MLVTYDPGVHEDLDTIERFIAKDNPERALTFTLELMDEAEKLADQPMRNPRISEKYGDGYRKHHYKGYTFYYKVAESEVRILEIFQQAKETHRISPVK